MPDQPDQPDHKTRRLGWMAIAAMFFLVQLAYVIVPTDIIPDVVPVLGWLDDVVVMLISLAATAAAGSMALRKDPNRPDAIDGPVDDR